MINTIKIDAEHKMQKVLGSLRHELTKIRTGRANAGLLDHIQVEYYGNSTPLTQIASITVSDARTLLVTPWDNSMVAVIEKAILNADLGLNPATAGHTIRVPMPALTEARRKELIKVVKHESEQTKISIRNIRRDANNHYKDLVKAKTLSDDDAHRANEHIQKLTDKYIADVEQTLLAKEKDLLAGG